MQIAQNILQINKSQLCKNIKIIKNFLPKNVKICFPIKANAYGHDLELIASCVNDLVDYFAVSCIYEAIRVRKINKNKKILVLGSVSKNLLNLAISNNVVISIQNLEDIDFIENYLSSSSQKITVHIGINTGMNRMGVDYKNYKKTIDKVFNSKKIILEGVYSHFACADEQENINNKIQIEKFNNIIKYVKMKNSDIICHLANSYGMIGQNDVFFDMVRPGILCYGFLPEFKVNKKIYNIKPIAKLITKIVKIIKLTNEQNKVGYSLTYQGEEGEFIAIIPIGYGDGFPRALSNKGCIYINNKKYPIVGKMSMDYLSISLGKNSENIKLNQTVEVISDNNYKDNSVENIAKQLNTITYDIVSTLNTRISRELI